MDMDSNLEIFELSELDRAETAALFDSMRSERAQVITVSCKPDGNISLVTPFDRYTTKRLLLELGHELEWVLVH